MEFIQGIRRLKREFKIHFVTTLDLEPVSRNDRIYFKHQSCASWTRGRSNLTNWRYVRLLIFSSFPIRIVLLHLRKKYVAGNLIQEDFLEIWNDGERWAIYRDLERYKNETCKKCDYYKSGRCIGNCPIMRKNPAAFDPYCYLHLGPEFSIQAGDENENL